LYACRFNSQREKAFKAIRLFDSQDEDIEMASLAAIEEPLELHSGVPRTGADVEVLIRTVYRQVLGNAYVMESERLVVPESQLKRGDISVREFVRQVAKSELYRTRFVDNCYRYRSIELNFKHLLGRAPNDYSEMVEHSNILDEKGFEADIDSYIDSLEYQQNFGEDVVPYHLGFQSQVGQKNVGFNRMFQLYRGYASSDRAQAQKKGRLTRELVTNTASPIYPASSGSLTGISTGGRGGNTYRLRIMQPPSAASAVVRRSVSELNVPFEQLSSKLQQLNRKGFKIMSISPS
jgi:phycocyanin-associated rod linker protein